MKRLFVCIFGRSPGGLDLTLILFAILLALPTVGYPFGRDQALYFCVGREWLAGFLPYRDVFDHKPPGIHIIYAFSTLLFGPHQWAIRLTELLAVVGLGWLVAATVRRRQPRQPGEAGLLSLLAVGFYFTCFDYWDTAQAEPWEALALLGSVCVAERDSRPWRRALLSGGLAGIAVLFKLPVIVMATVPALLVAWRAWEAEENRRGRRAVESLGMFMAGGAGILCLAVVYFAVKGGLGAMFDLVVGVNTTYLLQQTVGLEAALAMPVQFWVHHCPVWVSMALIAWLIGLLGAVRSRALHVARGMGKAMILVFLAVLSVVLQKKFYSYHWAVVMPFLVLCIAYGIAELARWGPRLTVLAGLCAVLIGFEFGPKWLANGATDYRAATAEFWTYAVGDLNRPAYLAKFVGGFGYNYPEQERLGFLIRERARNGDMLLVRGYEPTIYAVSGLRSPTRFLVEIPFIDPMLNYRAGEWIAEYHHALLLRPPRFMVIFSGQENSPLIPWVSYKPISREGRLVALERVP